jgi:hypothetical protein
MEILLTLYALAVLLAISGCLLRLLLPVALLPFAFVQAVFKMLQNKNGQRKKGLLILACAVIIFCCIGFFASL